MRITISHKKTKAGVIESVDRSFDQLFQGVAGIPVRVVVQQKSWQGSILSFQLNAKMGLMSTPIKGTVEVTDHDLTVDADLGMLEKFLPVESACDVIGKHIKGAIEVVAVAIFGRFAGREDSARVPHLRHLHGTERT